MSRRSARATFHGRLLVIQRHRAGWPRAGVAETIGVSRRCVAKRIAIQVRKRTMTDGPFLAVPHLSEPDSITGQVLPASKKTRSVTSAHPGHWRT